MTAGIRLIVLLVATAAIIVLAIIVLLNSEIDLNDQQSGLQIESFQTVQDRQTGETIVRIDGNSLTAETSAWLLPENSERNAVVTTIKTWGGASDILVKGNKAYLANGRRGLLIIDVGRPDHPRIISSLELPSVAVHIAADDRFVYVSCVKGGLHIVDIADLEHPALAVSVPIAPWRILLDGSLAYVADQKAGLRVLDISDPRHPTIISTLALPGVPLSLVRNGDKTLLVPLGKDGCAAVDISNPTEPRLLGRPINDAFVWDAAVDEDLAVLVLNRDSRKSRIFGRAEVYDCSDPGRLRLRGSCLLNSLPWRVSLTEGKALIALGSSGFSVVAIRPPKQPAELSRFESTKNCRVVIPYGESLLAVDRKGELLVIDEARLPKNPPFDPLYCLIPSWQLLPDRDTTTFLCRRYQGGAHLVTWNGRSKPQILAPVATDGQLTSLAMHDRLAAISLDLRQNNFAHDVLIADLSEPSQPEILSRLHFEQSVNDLAWSGDNLIVEANGVEDSVDKRPLLDSERYPVSSGTFYWIKLYSLEDPERPRELSSIRLSGLRSDLVVHGHLLIVSAEEADNHELLLFDLARPRQLEVVGRLRLPSLLNPFFNLQDMVIRGTTAYVAGGRAGLLVLDLSRPESPQIISTLDLGGHLRSLKLNADLAFAALDDQGIVVVDIENSRDPRVIGSYPYTPGPFDQLLLPDRLLVGRTSYDASRWYRYPLRLKQNRSVGDQHLEVRVPGDLDPGNYSIWLSRGHELVEMPSVISRGIF